MRAGLLASSIAALVLLAAASVAHGAALPRVAPVDLSGVRAPDRLPDLGAKPRLPPWLKPAARRGRVRAAHHWSNLRVVERRFRDQHGHVLTLATDNRSLDLTPFARLLASTYHHGESEALHMFVTNDARLGRNCGARAVACYAADAPGRSGGGVMLVSYQDEDIVHAVIHEYGHHVDTNTYNLGRLSDCGESGDGSRRWFFARELEDRILDNLSCDPRPGWGQLLPEVFAEDYAQMVGIPPAEFHPAIRVPPPSERQKRLLREDMDSPFRPVVRRARGRSSRSGTAVFRFRSSVPVFVSARRKRGVRRISLRGCRYEDFRSVFAGSCRVVVRTKGRRARFSFELVIF